MKNKSLSFTYILVAITIILFVFESVTRIVFHIDFIYQLGGALNILSGKGYAILAETSNCDALIFNSYSASPIGLSLLSLIFLSFTKDFFYLDLLFKIIFYFIIVFYTYKIGEILFDKKFYRSLFLLIVLSFSLNGATIDLVTFAFFIASIWYFSIASSENNKLWIALSLLFATILLRYAYYPQLALLPLSILSLNFLEKKKLINKNLIKSVVFISLGFLLYFAWLNINNNNNISNVESRLGKEHFYFENILHFRPIFVDYFIDTYKIYRFLGFDYVSYDRGFSIPLYLRVITLLISTGMFVFSQIFLYKNILVAKTKTERSVLIIFFISATINILFIYSLSFYFTSSRQDYIWTWAMIPRYFIINFFVFSYVLIKLISNNIPKVSKIVFGVIIVFLVLNFADKVRLQATVYNLDQKHNIEAMYPNTNLLALHEFYNKYSNNRGEYCIDIDYEKFSELETKWIKVYLIALNFPTNDSKNPDESSIKVPMGQHYFTLIKR